MLVVLAHAWLARTELVRAVLVVPARAWLARIDFVLAVLVVLELARIELVLAALVEPAQRVPAVRAPSVRAVLAQRERVELAELGRVYLAAPAVLAPPGCVVLAWFAHIVLVLAWPARAWLAFAGRWRSARRQEPTPFVTTGQPILQHKQHK